MMHALTLAHGVTQGGPSSEDLFVRVVIGLAVLAVLYILVELFLAWREGR